MKKLFFILLAFGSCFKSQDSTHCYICNQQLQGYPPNSAMSKIVIDTVCDMTSSSALAYESSMPGWSINCSFYK